MDTLKDNTSSRKECFTKPRISQTYKLNSVGIFIKLSCQDDILCHSIRHEFRLEFDRHFIQTYEFISTDFRYMKTVFCSFLLPFLKPTPVCFSNHETQRTCSLLASFATFLEAPFFRKLNPSLLSLKGTKQQHLTNHN